MFQLGIVQKFKRIIIIQGITKHLINLLEVFEGEYPRKKDKRKILKKHIKESMA